MIDRSALCGVMAALTTPFHRDTHQTIDFDGVEANAVALADSQVSAFVVGGTMAEPFSLSWDELVQSLEVIRGTVGDSGVVVLGTESRPETWRASCKLVRDGMADALMVKPSAGSVDEVLNELRMLNADHTPFIVYENPSIADAIDILAIGRVPEFEYVIGYKYAGQDMVRFSYIVDILGSELAVIAGAEDPLYFALAAGPAGCMPATAAFAPGFIKQLSDAVEAGDLETARDLNRRLMAYRRLLQPRSSRGELAFIPYTKAAMDLAGLVGGDPRHPMTPLSDEERRELEIVLERNSIL